MWTSIDHTVIDATLFSWPVFAEPARALILGSHGSAWIAADATPPPEAADTIGPAMVEIDPAVIRAGAAATLAARVPGLHPVGLRSSWWTGPAADLLPLARTFPIVAELTGPPRTQRRLLDEHGVDALAVKSRDTGEAPATILRELGRRPGTRDVLVVTRRNDRVVRYLCRRSR
jgi:hypothetical protein